MSYGDKELFAICVDRDVSMITEAFADEVLKEK
jgi:hypothetical protein